jgi:hypothetical protein
MAENEAKFLIYLKYETIAEMLKVISSSGLPTLGLTPILYLNGRILFMLSPFGERVIINYTTIPEESALRLKNHDLIKLEGSAEELSKTLVDNILAKGSDEELKKILVDEKKSPKSGVQLLYIPIIKVEKTSLKFPL